MTRVTLHSLAGQPVLYEDFEDDEAAADWAMRAAATLPCQVATRPIDRIDRLQASRPKR